MCVSARVCAHGEENRYDYATGTIAPDVEAQADQAMRNAAAALAGAGACLRHAVRVRYVLPDKQDFPRIWPVLRRWWIGSDGEDGDDAGGSRPAATMIQAGLMEDVMRIEIEVTAVKPATGTGVAFETVML